MTRHHPACPPGAHVHHIGKAVLAFSGPAIFDGDTVILCIDRVVAERVAELLNRHGWTDVPDHAPHDWVWAAPDPADRIIDWRLPEVPR